MKKLLLAAALLCAAVPSYASNTTVTATVKDTDNQLWYNGTWTAKLVLPSGPFGNVTPSVGGVPVPTTAHGVMDDTGTFTAILTDTGTLDQPNGQWQITVCPNVSVSTSISSGCYTYTTAVKGPNPDFSPSFSSVPAPRIPAGVNAFAYSDGEILAVATPGLTYFNTGKIAGYQGLRVWDGKEWKGVGAGGGGGNPAGTDYDVQLNLLNSFAADPGKFVYNPTTHFLTSNANGKINSDIYNTGNNGIANALAATNCGTNCQVYQPPTSTDSEAIPVPDSGKEVVSERAASHVRSVTNPGSVAISNPSTTGATLNPCNGSQGDCDQPVFTETDPFGSPNPPGRPHNKMYNTQVDRVGWNLGNAPYSNWSWMVAKGIDNQQTFNNNGITQAYSSWTNKYGSGDTRSIYTYMNVDSGSPDFSHEGSGGITTNVAQNSTFFHGLISSAVSQGATTLPVAFDSSASNNRNATSGDGYIIDMSQPLVTGTVTGLASPQSGIPPLVNSIPITGGSTVASTAYGTPCNACNMHNADPSGNPNGTISETITVNVNANTPGGFSAGTVMIAGDFTEMGTISNPGTVSGGVQTVTITHRRPHQATSTSLWQGGTQGFVIYNALNTLSSTTFAYIVVGAPDTTHYAVEENAVQALGSYSPYIAPTPLTSLVQSGTTVTATPVAGSTAPQMNKLTSAVVTGCSDPTLNQTVSNVSYSLATNTATWTNPTSGTATCSSASLGYPSSQFGFTIYAGSRLMSRGGLSAPTNLVVEPNNVAWGNGDHIINTFQPYTSIDLHRAGMTVSNPMAQANGALFAIGGPGINSQTPGVLGAINLNQCTIYKGCGGTQDLPQAIINMAQYGTGSPKGTAINFGTSPIGNQPLLVLGLAEAPLGGANNNDPIWLWNIGRQPGNTGRSYYNPNPTNPSWDFSGELHSLGSGTFAKPGGRFVGGVFKSNGSVAGSNGQFGGIHFSLDGTNDIGAMGPCTVAQTVKNVYVTTNCTPPSGTNSSDYAVLDTGLSALNVTAQKTLSAGGVTLALPPVYYRPTGTVSGGTGTQRLYFYTMVSPLGVESPQGLLGVFSTAATLDGSNFVTFTCPSSVQGNVPSGTFYRLSYRYDSANRIVIGDCPTGGGTVVDNGSATTVTATPFLNLNGYGEATQWRVAHNGGFGFYTDDTATTMDAFVNRIGTKKLGIGSTVGAAHDGSLELGAIQVDGLASAGAQCLQADASGNITGTGTACGSGTGPGGTVTTFSATFPSALLTSSVANPTTTPALSVSLAAASAHSFFGNCSGSSGTPGYCQPSFADITGTAAAAQLPLATTSAFGAVKPDGTTITIAGGVISSTGGGGGISGLTAGYIPQATSSTAIGNSFIDYGVTNAGAYTSSKDIYAPAFHSTDTGGAGFGFVGTEGTAPTGVTGSDGLWADSTSHRLMMNNNNTGAVTVASLSDQASSSAFGVVKCGTGTTCTGGVISVSGGGSGIANVTVTLPTTLIAANTCTAAATVTMTGVTTTSAFSTAFATDPSAVTGWGSSGGLSFVSWPTANTLNWRVCNVTGASITPGAMSLNVGAN